MSLHLRLGASEVTQSREGAAAQRYDTVSPWDPIGGRAEPSHAEAYTHKGIINTYIHKRLSVSVRMSPSER